MANALNTIYRFAIPLAAGFGLAQASLYDVKGGNRAIIFDRLSGVREGVVNEGTHFLIPWLQKAIVYDVRTKPRNISTTTGSKDLQMVSLTLRVLHRPEVSKLSTIYQVCDTLHCFISVAIILTKYDRISAKTTTSASSPPSETKSSKPSSHNSTPPSSSPSVKLSQIASAPSS
jgi:regulator of protease activity HflC (stomatin/prohibitin superfamily)